MSSKLTGTIISASTAYVDSSYPATNAFDGNFSTFSDGNPSAWVGLSLATPAYIDLVKAAGRSGQEARTVGAVFEASNDPTFATATTLVTVAISLPSGSLTSYAVSPPSGPWSYLRYKGASDRAFSIAEVEFWGDANPPGWHLGSRAIRPSEAA